MIYYKYFKTKIHYEENGTAITTNRDRVIDIFENKQVYFSNRDQLNDPFEGKPNLETIKNPNTRSALVWQFIKRQSHLNSLGRKEKEKRHKKIMINTSDADESKRRFHDLLGKYGLFCVTKNYDDILMWSHYGEAHTGLCLGFQFDDNHDPMWGPIFDIAYDEKYPIIDLEHFLNPALYEDNASDATHKKALLTKSSHWKYEDEYRFIRILAQGGFGKAVFPSRCLKRMILGALMPPADKNFFKQLAKNYDQHIEVYEAEISETEYKVVIPGLNDK